jgi:hypothetical protein
MGRIDDAIRTLERIEDETERAMQLAGLISTLFKIKGVLVITGQLAFDGYAHTASEKPEVELAAFAGDLEPRAILEIMRGQLHGKGSIYTWTVAGTPVRFQNDTVIVHRELCREFTTQMGVIKLLPIEEITADCILAAVHPEPDPDAHIKAHLLLINALTESINMNWTVLHSLCHRPNYRIGEELAQMRLEAKKNVDAMGLARDHIGETSVLPKVEAPKAEEFLNAVTLETAPPLTEETPDAMALDDPGVAEPVPSS